LTNDKFQKRLSRPSIIDARAHYWAAARRLRSTGLDNRLADDGKDVRPMHRQLSNGYQADFQESKAAEA
jgi:hypothetical protein